MIKKTISFIDWKGQKQTRDYYFHLSKPEIVELDLEVGGLAKLSENISTNNDAKASPKLFDTLIRRSYGVISEDGMRHMKSKKITNAFIQSPAFEELYMELLSDPSGEKAIDFFTSVIPVEDIG